MCVPASAGFSETTLLLARLECRTRQMRIRQRKYSVSNCGIVAAGSGVSGEESASNAGSSVDHRTRIAHLNPMETERMSCPVWQLKLYLRDSERIWGGGGGGGGGGRQRMFTLGSWHQRYHEKSHQPMDRGDCQGSLHPVRPGAWTGDSAWGQSTISVMGLQLSDGLTWYLGSGVLEVIWGLPEFVSARYGLYRWWHVYTGSSGRRPTSCGSSTSSPTSLAYTICMQPLLRRS